MNDTITLPKKCLRFLLWQRAEYRSKLLTRLPIPTRYYMRYLAGSWFEHTRKNKIEKLFALDLRKKFFLMKPYLPKNINRSIDIGCGIAGINIFLARHYLPTKPEIWLLDKNDDSPNRFEHYAGFQKETAAYNDLALSNFILQKNNIPGSQIFTVNVAKDDFPNKKFDVVISLLSWGFHYPVSYYLNTVRQNITKSSVVFIDIRRETNGLKDMENAFKEVVILEAGEKHDFIMAKDMQ